MLGSLFRFLLFAAAAYGGIVAVATVFQRSLQYFPFGDPGTPAEAGVPETDSTSAVPTDRAAILNGLDCMDIPPTEQVARTVPSDAMVAQAAVRT